MSASPELAWFLGPFKWSSLWYKFPYCATWSKPHCLIISFYPTEPRTSSSFQRCCLIYPKFVTSHNKAVKTSIHCASLLSAGPFISHSSFQPALPPSSNPYPAQPMTAALPAWHSHHAFPSGSKRKVIFHSLFSSFSTVWHQLDGVHENASMLSLLHLSVAMHQGAVCTIHERTAANSLWLGHVWKCYGQMENTNHCVDLTSVIQCHGRV